MKLVVISFFLFVGLNGFGQNSDTTKVYWNDGEHYKYWEWSESNKIHNKEFGIIDVVWELKKCYFNKKGKKISPQDFLKQYGQEEIDSINLVLSILYSTSDSINDVSTISALDKLYSDYIKNADNKMFMKKYESALEYYKKANAIKPNEQYPIGKMFENNELLSYANFNGNSNTKGFKAIIHWKHIDSFNVYYEENGQIIKTLKNDSSSENYLSINIIHDSKGYYAGEIYYEMGGDTIYGWIEKKEYIGAIMKKEKFPMNLNLYSKPKEHSRYLIELKGWNPSFVTIEDCDSYWALITITYKGTRKTGWIRYDKLCANNYSTCG